LEGTRHPIMTTPCHRRPSDSQPQPFNDHFTLTNAEWSFSWELTGKIRLH
jgi:hypothetical protein